ncbi:UNVERIFIED_CONTAM: hypothetical protein Sindi_2461800 [Sesamum indicum]
MKQPLEYVAKGKNYLVCKLKKAVYGLKQIHELDLKNSSSYYLDFLGARQINKFLYERGSQEAGLLGTKPIDTPLDFSSDLWKDDNDCLEDMTKYRLVGRLIYLTVVLNISFLASLVSQFMDKPRLIRWQAALRILKYIKGAPGKGLLLERHGDVKIEAYSNSDTGLALKMTEDLLPDIVPMLAEIL